MILSRRDARTEAVLARSVQLRAQLEEMAAELDGFVHALQAEVERLHHPEEEPHG